MKDQSRSGDSYGNGKNHLKHPGPTNIWRFEFVMKMLLILLFFLFFLCSMPVLWHYSPTYLELLFSVLIVCMKRIAQNQRWKHALFLAHVNKALGLAKEARRKDMQSRPREFFYYYYCTGVIFTTCFLCAYVYLIFCLFVCLFSPVSFNYLYLSFNVLFPFCLSVCLLSLFRLFWLLRLRLICFPRLLNCLIQRFVFAKKQKKQKSKAIWKRISDNCDPL